MNGRFNSKPDVLAQDQGVELRHLDMFCLNRDKIIPVKVVKIY